MHTPGVPLPRRNVPGCSDDFHDFRQYVTLQAGGSRRIRPHLNEHRTQDSPASWQMQNRLAEISGCQNPMPFSTLVFPGKTGKTVAEFLESWQHFFGFNLIAV